MSTWRWKSDMSTWLPTSGRKIPHTVVGGYDPQRKENFLIGHAQYKGHTIPGRISRAEGCLYMSYGGEEITSEKYNILLVFQPTKWTPESGEQAEDKIDSSDKAEPEESPKDKRKDDTKDAKEKSIVGPLPEFLKNAVQGGTTKDGEPIFIARAKGPDGVFYPGRLGLNEKICYMPFGGKEIARDRFEILKYATNEK